jgi:NitT/TauT family transport system ATP-binding protein
MTNPEVEVTSVETIATKPATTPRNPYAQALPHVRTGGISGLLELVVEKPNATDDLPQLAERLQLEIDNLLPIVDAAVLLGFAKVTQGDISLTEIGIDFATTTILRSKDLFRQQILSHVPIIASMVQSLREKQNRSMRSAFFLDLLESNFPQQEAERQFATAVDWGRYAELFEYDAREERLYLPETLATSEETRSLV